MVETKGINIKIQTFQLDIDIFKIINTNFPLRIKE